MLGSMGIRTILSLVLGLMVLGTLVSFSTVGSIGGAIQQGFDQISGQTDFTTEIEDKETLSFLTIFVRHRAVNRGCEVVEEWNSNEGYEGLEGTRLTRTPECFGTDASIIRGGGNAIGGGANDNFMPGIYSRERFEINSTLALDTNNGDSWIEEGDNLATIHEGGPESLEAYQPPAANDVEIEQKSDSYTWLYENEEIILGTTEVRETPATGAMVFFEERGILEKRTNVEEIEDADEAEFMLNLCEGDKGYIQGSRDKIGSESATVSGGLDNGKVLYPIIVIEETEQESCGNVGGRAELVPEETKVSGRMLHVTSDTTDNYPYLLGYLNPPSRVGDITDLSFNFKNFNEDKDIDIPLWGTSIEYQYNPDKSNKCVIAMYDHTIGGHDALGRVTIDQGHKIDYNDAFPVRDDPDVSDYDLEHDESRPPGQTPRSARDLYDRFADDYSGEGGFNTGWNSWEESSTELLYNNFAGEQQFAPYGDILCGEHDNNDNFDDEHSKWYMCSSTMIGNEIEAGENSYTCERDGDWAISSTSTPTCDSDEKLCDKPDGATFCLQEGLSCDIINE